LRRHDAALSPPADDSWKNRDEDHEKNDNLDVLIDARNISSQEIPGEQHAPYPEKRAEHTDREEHAIWHLRCSCDNGRESSDDWHELREHDRLTSMLFVELARTQKVFLVEEKRALSLENSGTGCMTDEIPAGISANRRSMQQDAEEIDVEKSASGNESGGYKERITRKKKSDEQARFGEDNACHAEVPGPFDKALQVGEIREQLAQLIH
jgi:hypothetical protein